MSRLTAPTPIPSCVRWIAVAAVGFAEVAIPSSAVAASPAAPVAFCPGPYAEDFSSLSAAARDFDHRPEATFSYCTRNTAVAASAKGPTPGQAATP